MDGMFVPHAPSLPPPLSPYIEALISSVSVFRDRGYKEVIKVKWDHKDGALIL